MTKAQTPVAAQALQKGHPKGLYILFFAEMWERFSYYGMRAVLVYYMMDTLLFNQEKSSQIYGLYTGLVYGACLLGGFLADRVIGQRKSVILGALLMAVGQFLLMSQSLFYPGLLFLIFGVGCFKSNVSTQVGSLYKEGDPRRDRAFSVFYVGINIGGFLGPLVSGVIGKLYGWNYCFGAAGIFILLGLVVYLFGQKHLAPDNIMKQKAGTVSKVKVPLTHAEKNGIWALVVLAAFNVVFWATYEQQGNTMALWIRDFTNLDIFGFQMPEAWFQSFNPAMIFIFTPLVVSFWRWQAQRGTEPSTTAKLAIGCLLLGTSFLIMVAAAMVSGGTRVSLWWATASTALLTIGELYMSPVGLSMVTKIAPIRLVSTLMGVWFFSIFLGNYLCGVFGMFWEKIPKSSFFLLMAVLGIAAGLGIFAVHSPLKKAMGATGAADV